ncbi:uncharacterized protein F4822DRAFT_428510 [Hypoxylon trugodes]|uniref:uncharacterized protein n=1 Tax=Hypoxylon trugodes TaxID=326681 RepID=UPI00219F288D|nr:uncharacterized protein F4822DRAFT_428510 [Hypoxylon trugodes]KAI1390167.1 hypothetical protein F4822DRAFT_428510 [Hypoxylon trugodes]
MGRVRSRVEVPRGPIVSIQTKAKRVVQQTAGFVMRGNIARPSPVIVGEDLETCARNAGFDLPASASDTPPTGAVAIAASTVTDRTITVIPFLKASSTQMPTPIPTHIDIQNGGCSFGTPADLTTSAPVPTLISHTNGTTPSIVQVSFATRQLGILAGPMTVVGIIGVLMTLS